MLQLQGQYGTAKVFTEFVEQQAISQIIELLNQPWTKGLIIRIMPDVHAGAGCTIGTTMTIKDKIVPNLVGVDIGCGMYTLPLSQVNFKMEQLDEVIHIDVPAGFNIRKKKHALLKLIDLEELRCKKHLNINRAEYSLGSLGGGNHFIEVDIADDGMHYLIIHSGSRYLGKQVAEHYQAKAYDQLVSLKNKKNRIVDRLLREGRDNEIESELSKLRPVKISRSLAYCEKRLFDDYIHDMKIVQRYASLNRQAMMEVILRGLSITPDNEGFETVHNYLDMESLILRKGAVSARLDEKLLIPINMRDGSLICIGKGNIDWNLSAPHGAGRLMSRSMAKQQINFEEFKKSMKGIYSTSISRSTLDESPMAYKSIDDIVNNIGDTVSIVENIKPIFNFKA